MVEDEIVRKGTGCVEIKSDYGLNTADELKMLRVIRRIKESTPAEVVSTFGAPPFPAPATRGGAVGRGRS